MTRDLKLSTAAQWNVKALTVYYFAKLQFVRCLHLDTSIHKLPSCAVESVDQSSSISVPHVKYWMNWNVFQVYNQLIYS